MRQVFQTGFAHRQTPDAGPAGHGNAPAMRRDAVPGCGATSSIDVSGTFF
jgi:hypothetical protein